MAHARRSRDALSIAGQKSRRANRVHGFSDLARGATGIVRSMRNGPIIAIFP
jgi:hypothetical protein